MIYIWRGGLVLAMVVFFVALLNQNIPFGGQKHVDYLLGEPSPYLGVWPGQGVSGSEERDGVQFRTLTKDSLYLDLKTPVRYRSVNVSVIIRGVSTDPEVGVRMPSGEWQYRKVSMQKESQEGEWIKYSANLDLSGAEYRNDRYTLLLHFAQGSNKESQSLLQVSRLHLVLSRDPLTPGRIWTKISEALSTHP